MVWNPSLLQLTYVILVASSSVAKEKKGRRKHDYEDKSLWKKEYESELNNAILSSRKRENVTRVVQSPSAMDNEDVLERLMDTITASEKYLKKVDSIDFRLNRLDIEVHEKTNSILKYLTEIMKTVQNQSGGEKVEAILDTLKTDMSAVKAMAEKSPTMGSDAYPADGREPHLDAALDARLTFLEGNVKNILVGVESIVNTITEVKNRQHTRSKPVKNEGTSSTSEALTLISEFRRTLQEKAKRCECKTGRVDRSERYPTDCHEIQMQGFNISGIYKIKPEDMDPFYVLCDLTTAGGGWTVFQNRFDGSQDFFKSWADYKHGFGNLAGEFWLGLEKLHYLTNQKLYEMRVDMETQHGHDAYAAYSVFTIGPEYEGYRISTLGTFYGTAGDSLSYHAGQKFSANDVDNDDWKDGSCAIEHGGAWWYKECDKSNLNGIYSLTAEEHRGQTIYWISFKGPNFPLTKTKMMIRPLPASRPNDFGDQTRSMKIPEAVELRSLSEKQIKPPHSRDSKSKLRSDAYRYNEPPPADGFFTSYS